MASALVYDSLAAGADVTPGALFDGCKFWVAQRVPMRAALLDKIRVNGGSIVPLEKQADWLIADHFRKDCAPGTTSYEFIDKSLAKGAMLDPADFPAGPRVGTARDVGSMARPAKGTRAAYTPDEDLQLYKWVRAAQAKGVAVSGNELYKQLEAKAGHMSGAYEPTHTLTRPEPATHMAVVARPLPQEAAVHVPLGLHPPRQRPARAALSAPGPAVQSP